MSSQHASAKEVTFAIQPQRQYAAHLRLTPQLLDALIRGHAHSEPLTIQFGATPTGNVITVGESQFGFNPVNETSTCDLLRIPTDGGAAASIVAHVKQKFLLQRNLVAEKGRVRARAEEAERERKERKTMVLSGKPLPGAKGGTITEKHVRSVTPPPRGPTPPPRPKPPPTQTMLVASMPQPPRPPLPHGAAAQPPSNNRPTPPPGTQGPPPAAGTTATAAAAAAGRAAANPAGAKAGGMKKSASTPRLGLGAKHGSSATLATAGTASGAGATRASPVVLAAARKGGLRDALLALLAERPATMQGVRSGLTDVASRIREFKVPSDKSALERALKSISEFRTPGKYFLFTWTQEEAEAAAAPGGRWGIGGGREVSPPSSDEVVGDPEVGRPGGKLKAGGKVEPQQGQQQQGRSKAAGAVAGGGGGKRSREATPESAMYDRGDPQQAQQQPHKGQNVAHRSAAGSGGPLPKTKRSASQPALGAGTAAMPPVASPASRDTPPSVATTTTTTTSGAGGGEGPASGAAKRARHGSNAADASGVAGRGLPGRSSSSRGSQDYDDSWIQQHADRQPEAAGPISCKEEYREREAAFNRKYEVYFRLHQLIEANKKDFHALQDALDAAGSTEEKQRHQAEIEKLGRKRGERAKRWDAAFRVLHTELGAAKQRMAEFVQAFQQAQQVQQPQGQQQAQQQAAAVPVK